MSTPVYYLKISVKILNKMTVCKPQRRALMLATEYLCSPALNHFSRLSLSALSSVHCPLKARAERTGKCEKEAEQEEQRGMEVQGWRGGG